LNYAGLNIKGKCFSKLTSIIFENTNSRPALVFGKNGSGKSTIAQGLKLISGNEKLTEYDTLELLTYVTQWSI